MIYMWFTGINYSKLAVEKDRDSIFTTIWKPGFKAQSNEQMSWWKLKLWVRRLGNSLRTAISKTRNSGTAFRNTGKQKSLNLLKIRKKLPGYVKLLLEKLLRKTCFFIFWLADSLLLITNWNLSHSNKYLPERRNQT